MANAKQCDRCGKFYLYDRSKATRIECKTHSGFNRRIGLDDPDYYIDLCENCLKSLNGWWVLKNG